MNPSFEQWVRDTFARRDETLTREQFDAAVAAAREQFDEDHKSVERRLAVLEEWKANLIGRGIAFTLIGAVLVAVCASVITRLIFGTG